MTGKRGRRDFVGCDGEGGGADPEGRQNYQLFRVGNNDICVADAIRDFGFGPVIDTRSFGNFRYEPPSPPPRLSTKACLELILEQPDDVILVGYYFDYDATQILRDLPPRKIDALFRPRQNGHSSFIYWNNYAIEYIPRKHLSVGRLVEDPATGKMRIRKGSVRAIHDVGSFFQQSFVQALEAWELATPIELIRNKERRAEFGIIGARERDYCRLECLLLEALMDRVRDACDRAGIKPRLWEGAGDIAAALLKSHGVTPRRHKPEPPPRVAELLAQAYFGGRFEITAHGPLPAVREYDISSAYPAAMLTIPARGTWHQSHHPHGRAPGGRDIPTLSAIRWDRANRGAPTLVEPFPVRSREGVLYFPMAGEGVFWEDEIEAGEAFYEALGAWSSTKPLIERLETWQFRPEKDSYETAFLAETYLERQKLGKDGAGKILKLGTNAVYGKRAQRVGSAPYGDLMIAGLATARTRAQLLRAAAQAPMDIVMFATDAVYSLAPLDLPCDPAKPLGGWELTEHSDLFVVQPGLYWSSDEMKLRTRGVGKRIIAGHRDEFQNAWQGFESMDARGTPPVVRVPVTLFRGLRLASARGKPELAGSWSKEWRDISFAWSTKRADGHFHDRAGIFRTVPKFATSRHDVAIRYRPLIGDDPYNMARETLEGQPDYLEAVDYVQGTE